MHRPITCLIAFLFLAFSTTAQQAFLDTTFGNQGFFSGNWGLISPFSGRSAMIIQPDHKILVRYLQVTDANGFNVKIRLCRFLENGEPDLTFGDNGAVLVNPENEFDQIIRGDRCLVLTGDGKIITAYGGFIDGNIKTIIRKYDEQGNPVAAFGNGGKVEIPEIYPLWLGDAPALSDIGLFSNGKILLFYHSFTSSYVDFGFRELNADGSLPGGSEIAWWQTDPTEEDAENMIIQPDNRILLGGRIVNHDAGGETYDMLMARFDPDGYVDEGFGNAGYVRRDISNSYDILYDFILLPDGKILGVGMADNIKLFLVRLNADGSPDMSFGNGGQRIFNGIHTDGVSRIEMSGLLADHRFVVTIATHSGIKNLWRFTAEGEVDSTLNSGQGVLVPHPPNDNDFIVDDIAVLDDYRMIICGHNEYASDTNRLVISRLLPFADAVPWYLDTDHDTYGADGAVVYAVEQPGGYVTQAGDCNDSNPAVHPGATELCNGFDDDCDGLTDEIPTLICVENLVVALNQDGTAVLSAEAVLDTSAQMLCTGNLVSLSLENGTFDCSDLGVTMVTLSGTNNLGITGSCVTQVVVADASNPLAKCVQQLQVLPDSSGIYTITPGAIDAGSSDNCGIVNYTVSPSQLTAANAGLTPVLLTVTDGSGNQAECTTVVEITEPSGAQTISGNLQVIISPNPAVDRLFITIPSGIVNQSVQLRVTDAHGRILRLQNWTPMVTSTPLDIGLLPDGHYYLQLEHGGKRQVLAFEKQTGF